MIISIDTVSWQMLVFASVFVSGLTTVCFCPIFAPHRKSWVAKGIGSMLASFAGAYIFTYLESMTPSIALAIIVFAVMWPFLFRFFDLGETNKTRVE